MYNYAGRVAEPADGWVYFSWKEQEGKLEGQLYILYADKSPRTVTNIRPHSDFRRLACKFILQEDICRNPTHAGSLDHSIGYYDGPWTSAVYKFVFNSLGECQELMRFISFVQRHLEEPEDPDNSSWRRRRHYSLLAPSA